MKLLRFLLLTMFPILSFAQNENDVWVFGYNVGIDFSSGAPVAITPSIMTNEGVCAISDADGNLMFYSNGNNIWNADYDIMPSGASLLPTDPSSSSQAAVIVPMPGNEDRYYVFSLEIVEFTGTTAPGRLYYSVVDMTLDGGLGDVVPGMSGILVDSALDEKMITIQGECNNVWLIVHSRLANEYFSYEITEDGVSSTPVVSVIGDGTMDTERKLLRRTITITILPRPLLKDLACWSIMILTRSRDKFPADMFWLGLLHHTTTRTYFTVYAFLRMILCFMQPHNRVASYNSIWLQEIWMQSLVLRSISTEVLRLSTEIYKQRPTERSILVSPFHRIYIQLKIPIWLVLAVDILRCHFRLWVPMPISVFKI
jgi:hypothetical protein